MSLADYEFPTTVIQIDPTHTFTVRGIDFSDLTRLANRHGPTLGLIYGRVIALSEDGKAPSGEQIGELLMTLAQEFPDLVAEVIATASDELSDPKGQDAKHVSKVIGNARKLRLPVVVEALYEITKLTIVEDHELKKVMEIVTKAAEGITRNVKSVTAPSTPSSNGAGAFVSG